MIFANYSGRKLVYDVKRSKAKIISKSEAKNERMFDNMS